MAYISPYKIIPSFRTYVHIHIIQKYTYAFVKYPILIYTYAYVIIIMSGGNSPGESGNEEHHVRAGRDAVRHTTRRTQCPPPPEHQRHDGGGSSCCQVCERYLSIQKFCADAGYRGTFVSDVKEQLGLDVDISEKIKPHRWEKLPCAGWLNAHSPSWLNHSRRLSKNYEISVSSAESMVKISHIHTLLKRL